MSEVLARPVPRQRPQAPVVHAAPRLGLASIQAVAFEGDNTTDAAWALVVETPEGEYRTLETGLTKGAKRTAAASVGEEYGRAVKRGALVDAFSALLKHHPELNIDTLAVHCPDAQVAEELKAVLTNQSSILVGSGRTITAGFRWGKVWETVRIAHLTASELASKETIKNPLRGATDGSLHPFNKGAGSGWILADGRGGANRVDTNEVLAAELSGLRDLLKALEKHQAVLVEIDSREALRVARAILSKGAHEASKNLSGIVNAICHEIEDLAKGRHVTLKWVKGHNGNRLNELADQLAVAASRRNRGLIDNQGLQQVVTRVRSEAF